VETGRLPPHVRLANMRKQRAAAAQLLQQQQQQQQQGKPGGLSLMQWVFVGIFVFNLYNNS
jgi:hypothetical protein